MRIITANLAKPAPEADKLSFTAKTDNHQHDFAERIQTPIAGSASTTRIVQVDR